MLSTTVDRVGINYVVMLSSKVIRSRAVDTNFQKISNRTTGDSQQDGRLREISTSLNPDNVGNASLRYKTLHSGGAKLEPITCYDQDPTVL